ncbi:MULTISPECIES: MucR family transcriptional regulator [unclassified Methylobacterium]|uniref:MucR family transcriptional regulator n=1 Tax=unclassified Methylobacterium TaxID=2615210 RepID=UPI001FB997D8|nr:MULTISPECIES: MucR family transcriptional regulator [unclassified Methylobacterium]MCJ2095197.1 MucR family transcriptional regulator [Methylobacterium sp. J-072]MCJ2141360.1 MucR family transcriptional regulator [Methylobacterium sp. E-066]
MPETIPESSTELAVLVGDVVAAYVSNNPVPPAALPALIASVHGALVNLGQRQPVEAEPVIEPPNAAQIRKSVQQDGIISFIDGRSYKTLKRHLTAHGLTPERYRERYSLPADYPMTAPGYAAQRSALAKAIGLGVPGARAEERRTGTRG